MRSGYEALCELRELVKINPAVSALRLYRTATGFYFPFFILINQRWPRFFAVVVKKENTQTQKTALVFLCVFLITYNQIWMIAITFYLVFSLMIATITCYLLYRYFLFWSPNTKDGQKILKGNFCRSKKLWPQESWWAAEVKVTLENLFRFTSSQCMGSFGRWKSNLLWWKYFARSWSFSRIRDLFYMKNSQKSFALCAPHCC